MVADDLALSLAAATVRPGARVLDPFCGSGRLLMAASAMGAVSTGYDVNPLACLITQAKAAKPCSNAIADLARQSVIAAAAAPAAEPLRLRGAKVEWFSPSVAVELAQILAWIAKLGLGHTETLIAGVALSAATRDSGWIRRSGWKLHRMHEAARSAHAVSAWHAFERRLQQYADAAEDHLLIGPVGVKLGSLGSASLSEDKYDVVLTSPPYGDSKTTVQYGATSGICLDVVSRIPGLQGLFKPGRTIDSECLGSSAIKETGITDLKPYWAGGLTNDGGKRVSRFLADFALTCRKLDGVVSPEGCVVMVVGRRSVGGYRVKLDAFAQVAMAELGFSTVAIERRRIHDKTLPRTINRFGGSKNIEQRHTGRTKTMDEEIILKFERSRATAS